MRIYQSRLGLALAALYAALVAKVAYDAYGCTNHSFPLVCDFPLGVVVLPALPLSGLGLGEPAFRSPGPGASDIALLCCTQASARPSSTSSATAPRGRTAASGADTGGPVTALRRG